MQPPSIRSGGGAPASLINRVAALEDGYVYAEWFKPVAAGALAGNLACAEETVPGAVFIADQYPDGIDAIVSRLGSDGRPDWEPARDAAGDPVTASFTLAGDPVGAAGDYLLSADPVDAVVGLVFRYRCSRKNHDPGKALAESVLRGIQVFEQALEPGAALPGDIWVDTSE